MKYLDASDITDRRTDAEPPRYGRTVYGYGKKIPTPHWLKVGGRWRRVYVTQFSNSGTSWITVNTERLIVR